LAVYDGIHEAVSDLESGSATRNSQSSNCVVTVTIAEELKAKMLNIISTVERFTIVWIKVTNYTRSVIRTGYE